MKIKSDFVTNSSSTSYIMSLPESEVDEFKKLISMFKQTISISKSSLKTVEEINKVMQDAGDELSYSKAKALEEILENNTNEVYFVDVSDELGTRFIECSIYNKFILIRTTDH